MIFNSFSDFQYSPQNSIRTIDGVVDNIKAYTLVGTTMMTGLPEQLILERKIDELQMDRITGHL